MFYTLCNLNHGIPSTIKIFWKNTPKDSVFSKYTFLHFDQYSISDKTGRRDNMARILTGREDLDSNSQIRYLHNHHNRYVFKYVKCSIFSDFKSAILILDNDHIIVGLYAYKRLYINSKYTQLTESDSSSLIIRGYEPLKLYRVYNNEMSENKMLSKVLDGKFDQFKYKKYSRVFEAEVIEEEKIKIRVLN